ncbi:hypothetical protein [Pseudoclavibacter soli]|uniref:hypothetical protein n=1 Tax=Pseudoclavibacter soli TaxID=452623 RepID=UPI000426CD95|nr:hypothetical protein [Pseudoclavibacter soli]
MSLRRTRRYRDAGDSLVEVIVSVFLIAAMGLGVVSVFTSTSTNAAKVSEVAERDRIQQSVLNLAEQASVAASEKLTTTGSQVEACKTWFTSFRQYPVATSYPLTEQMNIRLRVNSTQVSGASDAVWTVRKGSMTVPTASAINSLCSRVAATDENAVVTTTFRLAVRIGERTPEIEVITLAK